MCVCIVCIYGCEKSVSEMRDEVKKYIYADSRWRRGELAQVEVRERTTKNGCNGHEYESPP